MARNGKEKKISQYRLAMTEAQTHKQLWAFKFNKATLILTCTAAFITLTALMFCIIAFTPIKTLLPGYPDAVSRRAAVQNAIRIDSLEKVVYRWKLYSENLRRVVEGEQPVSIDSLLHKNNVAEVPANEAELEKKDSTLREMVLEEEKFDIGNSDRELAIEGLHFFSPLTGVISQGYDKYVHPYVDITAPANSVVKAILDGTVILAGWNEDSGYIIQIQHKNDIISIYKHNEKLLKKTGDKVTAGAPIALVGNSGSLSHGDHLHFELWYRGEAIDPTKYISF